MKKRILALALVSALGVCLCACNDDDKIMLPTPEQAINQAKGTINTLSDQADARDMRRTQLIEQNKVKIKGNATFSLPKADIKLKAYSVIPWESLGQPERQIYFLYDFINTDENDRSPSSVQVVAYQDGVRLDGAIYFDDNAATMIKNGVSISVASAFVLNNLESDVQVKFENYGEESEEYTVKIK